MTDRRKLFDERVRNDEATYNNIWKVIDGDEDDYTTCFMLDYPYFKKYCSMIDD